MIESIRIERFRGIESLTVAGLGRVNVVTGKNDCGKTAFLEAASSALVGALPALFQHKRGLAGPVWSFDAFWRPFFFDGDAEQGLSVELTQAGATSRLAARTEPASEGVVGSSGTPWAIRVDVAAQGQSRSHRVLGGGQETRVVPPWPAILDVLWISSVSNETTENDLRTLSSLKQAGADEAVVELMRVLNSDVRGVDILSPTGIQAAFYVRTGRSSFMLPLASMGEGSRRCFDLSLGVASGARVLFVDEIDNGLHHSVLTDVWTWIARVSKQRSLQVFATTHSDECIRAAAHAFQSLADDGLRLLRLDRGEHETTVAVYDRDLLLVAEADDVEVRG